MQLAALHRGVTKGAHYSSDSEHEVESRVLVKVILRSAERAKRAARGGGKHNQIEDRAIDKGQYVIVENDDACRQR